MGAPTAERNPAAWARRARSPSASLNRPKRAGRSVRYTSAATPRPSSLIRVPTGTSRAITPQCPTMTASPPGSYRTSPTLSTSRSRPSSATIRAKSSAAGRSRATMVATPPTPARLGGPDGRPPPQRGLLVCQALDLRTGLQIRDRSPHQLRELRQARLGVARQDLDAGCGSEGGPDAAAPDDRAPPRGASPTSLAVSRERASRPVVAIEARRLTRPVDDRRCSVAVH